MCRYARWGRDYTTHWACLACRHTARFPKGSDPICPRCRAGMIDLGWDFHAPRRRNINQWRKITLLVAAGITFNSCGCHGPGPRPRTLSEAKSQLGRRR